MVNHRCGNHNFFAAIIVGQVDEQTAEGQTDRRTEGQTEDLRSTRR